MARSYCGVRVRVSVALLSDGVLLGTSGPTGAVLLVGPGAEAAGVRWAVTVKVTVPPGSRVTSSATMLLLPLAVVTLEPLEATAVQLSLCQPTRPVRSVSLTGTPTAVLGPALLATMV